MEDYDIVEKYESTGVIKFVHANGMETTLKTVPGCSGEDKNKAVLFVSCSVGCRQKCKFCYLTTKNMPYEYVSDETIVEACKAVLNAVDIRDKYLKVSFMGMGEVFDSVYDLHSVTLDIIEHAISNDLVKGIDGVDVGTSVPSEYSHTTINDIHLINDYLIALKNVVGFNPANDYMDRSYVRLFVSLHSVDDSDRFKMMPKSSNIANLNKFINEFGGITIIFHVMLVDNLNDGALELVNMMDKFVFGKYKGSELRLLRFNKCEKSVYSESHRFDTFVDEARRRGINFKYQVSAGSEIQAACGQFLCKEILCQKE